MQYREGQQRMRCKNMKKSLQVLGDKWAHSDDDMKNGVKVMTQRTAHTSNNMRHRIKSWWRSCSSRILGLMTENSWNHECEPRAGQGNIHHPAYGTWTADFMSRQKESRAFLGKYLNELRVPWRHKRREMMAMAGIMPVGKWLAKIKQRSDVSCRLCKRARELKICRKRRMGTSTVLSAME